MRFTLFRVWKLKILKPNKIIEIKISGICFPDIGTGTATDFFF